MTAAMIRGVTVASVASASASSCPSRSSLRNLSWRKCPRQLQATNSSNFNLSRTLTSSTSNASASPTTNTETTTTTTTTTWPPPDLASSWPFTEAVNSMKDLQIERPNLSPYRSSPAQLASQILKTTWLPSDSPRRKELQEFLVKQTAIESSPQYLNRIVHECPQWVCSLFETIRSYRAARSRLWIPDGEELFKAEQRFTSLLESDSQSPRSKKDWLETLLSTAHHEYKEIGEGVIVEAQRQSHLSSLEEECLILMSKSERTEFGQLDQVEREDLIYRKVWSLMTVKEREKAMSRVTFQCIRKLGWRKGFTSGFPTSHRKFVSSEDTRSLLEERKTILKSLLPIKTSEPELEEQTLKILQGKKKLNDLEEKLAFESWNQMAPSRRREEEKSAWENRDRGRLFLSGGSTNPRSVTPSHLTTKVLGMSSNRWYSEPIRTGENIFLPNTIIRLVKNYTKPDEPYDCYKATFRIPYSMHKHSLKNYLLSIYGLRITWIRTMIYRSSRARSAPGGSRDLRDRGFGRRNFKKAEVGLYEPFLFPEISESYLREARGLLGEEMEVERMSGMIKLRGGKRWRSVRLPDGYQRESQNEVKQMGTAVHQPQLKGQDTIEVLQVDSDGQGNESVAKQVVQTGNKNRLAKRPKLLVRSGGIPTTRHSRILQMLGWKNQEREEKIRDVLDRQSQRQGDEK